MNWDSRWSDLRCRLTRRGRAQLRVRRTLRRMVEEQRDALARLDLEELRRKDRDDLMDKFRRWDDEEDQRIRSPLYDDMRGVLGASATVEDIDAFLSETRVLAKELPWAPPKVEPAPTGGRP